MIKFFGAKVLHDVVDRAVQIHGALGYSGDMPLEMLYRFARHARFVDGADEVHRELVARHELRGYEVPGRRRAERARPDPPRGRAAQVRGRSSRLKRTRPSTPLKSLRTDRLYQDEFSSGRAEGSSWRSKRHEVLTAATDRFGRDGYEHTKWADIAADIGVGATALYHYFESKQHCLYEIMDEAIEDFRGRFVAVVADERDPVRAIEAVMAECFDLSEHDVLRNRVLVAEQGRLSSPSTSEREEQARLAARSRMRELEFAWASFLAARDARRRDPGDRPAPAHARRARPLQQHLALVPPERDDRPGSGGRVLHGAGTRHDRPPPAARELERAAA